MPPGSLHCGKRSGQQKADRRQRGLRARDVLFLRLCQKQALGKLFMHRGQQSREGDWRCHTVRSCDTLKKRPTRIHPKTLLNSHFICMRTPAPRHLGLVAVPALPLGVMRPWGTHRTRCCGSDHIPQLLRSHVKVLQEHFADMQHPGLCLFQMHTSEVFSPQGAAQP